MPEFNIKLHGMVVVEAANYDEATKIANETILNTRNCKRVFQRSVEICEIL